MTRARITVASEMAIVALCDPSVALPSGTDQDALLRELEPLARAGRVFYLVTDDPVRYVVELLANEEPPAEISREFEPRGGTFGLTAPTGTLALHGWTKEGIPEAAGAVQARPGLQALSVLARRPFDGARHDEEMTALLGGEWTHVQRVDRLGLAGCLPLLLVAFSLFTRKWHWLWFMLPLLVASWAPHVVLRLARRYQTAARRVSEHEKARPHYVLSVMPADREGLAGGFVRD
jgi:hypothetical protein